MNARKHVIIIGGGISGMAAAYHLQEEARAAGCPITFTVLESGDRLGGKIATARQDGFVIEGGPDCFIGQKPWAAQLCQRLGIGGELIGTNDARRKTFVLNHGRLTPLPDGVMLIVPTRIMPFVTSSLISWPGKLRMGMDLIIPRRPNNDDESVADFVRRRLGTEALEKIAEPLMGGIHVSDPEMQSLLGTFPRFRDLENKHRSLILGMLAGKRSPARLKQTGAGQERGGVRGGVRDGVRGGGHAAAQNVAPEQVSFTTRAADAAPAHSNGNGHNGAAPLPSTLFVTLRNGLATLIETLQAALVDGQVRTGATAETMAWDGAQYHVTLATGETLTADAVVLATPAFVSARLVGQLAPRVAEILRCIRYVSTATVSLGFRQTDVGRPLNGFGYVVPRKEQRPVSACSYVSTKFDYRAPGDSLLVRAFVGGPGHEELVDLDDDQLLATVRQELAQIMGLTAQPVLTRIYRWPQGNPQYDVGHLERVAEMHARSTQQPGLFITGAAFEGVGVPDCVHQAQRAAQQAVKYLTR